MNAEADLLHGVDVAYRFYPHSGLRVSEIFPRGALYKGGSMITVYGAKRRRSAPISEHQNAPSPGEEEKTYTDWSDQCSTLL